jgi:hypothetical protein
MLIPGLVFSGGCMWLLFPKGFYDVSALNETCCTPLVAEDPAYLQPPASSLWQWYVKTKIREEGFFSPQLNSPLISSALHAYLARNPGATPHAFFSSLGMSCRISGAKTSCEYDFPASYVCARPIPKPEDFQRRRDGRLHLIIVAERESIESATSTLQKADGSWPCLN